MRKAVFLPPDRSAGQNNFPATCIFTTKLTGDTTFERDLHLLVALPHVELCRLNTCIHIRFATNEHIDDLTKREY